MVIPALRVPGQLRRKRIVFILFIAFLSAAGVFVWRRHDSMVEAGLEAWLNQAAAPYFQGSLELEGLNLDASLKLHIEKLTGDWKAPEGSFPIEIHRIVLKEPVTDFLFQKPVRIDFERLRPQGSSNEGVRGRVIFNEGAKGAFELKADLTGLGLEEITRLDPVNLKGASGTLSGSLVFKTGGAEALHINLKVSEPGGRLQARFFDVLLPYLPLADQQALGAIKDLKTVRYREADFEAALEGPETVKCLLHIRVPDYNLNLNLNMKIRVENQESFWELARFLGLLEARAHE